MKKGFFGLMFFSLIFLATAPALFAQNGCISAEIVYPSRTHPTPPPPDVDLIDFLITHAESPFGSSGGTTFPLEVIDCNGDGRRDVFVPWSEDVAGATLAEIKVNRSLCRLVAYPQTVAVSLVHRNACTLRAYDSANVLVDTAIALSFVKDQLLTLESHTGIERIEIIGAEICIKSICWSCECPLLGDVNNDGQINIIDALMIARYGVGLPVHPFNPACADVNCDGKINIIDALLVAQFYVQIITSFPCIC